MSLTEEFNAAVQQFLHLKSLAHSDTREQMYGWYMQATEGDCCAPKPEKAETEARRKWKAWYAARNLTRKEAMNNFIHQVKSLRQLQILRTSGGPDFLSDGSTPQNY